MNQFNSQTNQTGAALVIGLVLLVIVTILAVSGINTATTELAMARNDQNYENAFQAAETGLEIALSQGQLSTAGSITISDDVSANEKVTTVIEFQDSTLVPDKAFSLGVGSGVSAYHFLATSNSESRRQGTAGGTTDRDASAMHTQAFYLVGPEDTAL